MKKAQQLGFFILIFLIVGCSHIPFVGKEPPADEVDEQPFEVNEYVQQGRVINAQALKSGKKVAVIPFTPGVGVEANEELDKIALMVVKGISEAFEEKQSQFTVLTAENAEIAELIVTGHVNHIGDFNKMGSCAIIKRYRSPVPPSSTQ